MTECQKPQQKERKEERKRKEKKEEASVREKKRERERERCDGKRGYGMVMRSPTSRAERDVMVRGGMIWY